MSGILSLILNENGGRGREGMHGKPVGSGLERLRTCWLFAILPGMKERGLMKSKRHQNNAIIQSNVLRSKMRIQG
jgi:hypothetical protein